MQVRKARAEDGEKAALVVRRSITELCYADHQGDVATLNEWLANKTADTMRRWTERHHVFLATKAGAILGVGAMRSSGEVLTLHVSPDARFRGVSKGLLRRLEVQAAELGAGFVTLLSSATARSFYLSARYAETGPPVKGFGITLGYPMAKRLPSRGDHERAGSPADGMVKLEPGVSDHVPTRAQPELPHIECSIVFLPTSEGGRASPLPHGALSGDSYRPHLVIGEPTQRRAIVADGNRLVEEYIGIAFHDGPNIPRVGVEMNVVLTLAYFPHAMYDQLKPGVTFTLREGSQVVAYGRVGCWL